MWLKRWLMTHSDWSILLMHTAWQLPLLRFISSFEFVFLQFTSSSYLVFVRNYITYQYRHWKMYQKVRGKWVERSLQLKAWLVQLGRKKFGLPGFEPRALQDQCSALVNRTSTTTGSWSLNWFMSTPRNNFTIHYLTTFQYIQFYPVKIWISYKQSCAASNNLWTGSCRNAVRDMGLHPPLPLML